MRCEKYVFFIKEEKMTDINNLEDPKEAGEEQQVFNKPIRPYSKIPFDLKPENLTEEGVQKMILGEISRLEAQVYDLSQYEKKFHQINLECAVLQAEKKKMKFLEILYTLAIAVGSALLGWVPSSVNLSSQIVVVIMALSLIVFGLLAKWWQK